MARLAIAATFNHENGFHMVIMESDEFLLHPRTDSESSRNNYASGSRVHLPLLIKRRADIAIRNRPRNTWRLHPIETESRKSGASDKKHTLPAKPFSPEMRLRSVFFRASFAAERDIMHGSLIPGVGYGWLFLPCKETQ